MPYQRPRKEEKNIIVQRCIIKKYSIPSTSQNNSGGASEHNFIFIKESHNFCNNIINNLNLIIIIIINSFVIFELLIFVYTIKVFNDIIIIYCICLF